MDLPARIGPCELGQLGRWVTVRCPRELAPIMRRAGEWEPGSRRWLIEARRIGPVIRALRRDTIPLFRQAGLDLDEKRVDRIHAIHNARVQLFATALNNLGVGHPRRCHRALGQRHGVRLGRTSPSG